MAPKLLKITRAFPRAQAECLPTLDDDRHDIVLLSFSEKQKFLDLDNRDNNLGKLLEKQQITEQMNFLIRIKTDEIDEFYGASVYFHHLSLTYRKYKGVLDDF